MELSGKTAVITGGGRGLGKEIARALSRKGAAVKILARSFPELEGTSKEFPATPVECDITKEEDVKTALGKIGKIDILVNNAGIWIPHEFEELDIARVREMFEVNVFALMSVSKEAFGLIPPGGAIVNIISTAGLEAKSKRSPAYTASKFAAAGFSKAMRFRSKEAGISVLNVYPGGMRTGFHNERRPSDWDAFMDPKEVAGKIVANLEKETPEEELVIKRPGK